MKLIRALRKIDDLAELLVFDVLLATRRRRICASLGMMALIVAGYLVSGFVLAPTLESLHPAPAVRLPYADFFAILPSGQALPSHPSLLAGLIPHRRVAYIDAQPYELDAAVAVGEGEPALHLGDLSRLGHLHRIARLLADLSQSNLYAGNMDRGIGHLLGMARLGRAINRGTPIGATFTDAVVGAGIEQQALERLMNLLLHTPGGVRRDQLELLISELARRETEVPALVDIMHGQLQRVRLMVDAYVRDGAWPSDPALRGLRLWLPVRPQLRRLAADALLARLERSFWQALRLALEGVDLCSSGPNHRLPVLGVVLPAEIPDAIAMAGAFDRRLGVELSARLLTRTMLPGLALSLQCLRWRDDAAHRLLARCLTVHRQMMLTERMALAGYGPNGTVYFSGTGNGDLPPPPAATGGTGSGY